jgi:hypothetical protein
MARGERIARAVHHRHAVAQAFLTDVLGVDPGRAREEACALEHALSGATAYRLVDLLRLLHDDTALRDALQGRLTAYQRKCATNSECSTFDLSCVAPSKLVMMRVHDPSDPDTPCMATRVCLPGDCGGGGWFSTCGDPACSLQRS